MPADEDSSVYYEEIRIANPDDKFFQELVQTDLKLSRRQKLCISEKLLNSLLVQTCLGHAIEGHTVFYQAGVKYPFASITDIIKAASLDVREIKSIRQGLIDDFFEWLELAKKGLTDRLVYKGKPLMGVEFLNEDKYKIIPEFALRGAILAGCMDSYEWRMKTLKKFGRKTIDGNTLKIGGGETYLVDSRNPMWALSGPEAFANVKVSDDKIKELKTAGFFTTRDNPNAEVAYIRRELGLGTSDDTAFIVAGEMYRQYGEKAARSAMLGAFLVDASDTYDKCVSKPIEGGYDEKIGRDLIAAFPGLVSDDEIMTLIYYCAKGNGKYHSHRECPVSSSHKRLVQMVEKVDPEMPTILHHMKFMETGRFARFYVGFEQMPSFEFYGEVKKRLEHYRANAEKNKKP